MKAPPRKVVVLGAGIAGLVAARELSRRVTSDGLVEVEVLEASPRIGGKIRTEVLDGATIETGPDSFVAAKPEMLELVGELGLEGGLIWTAPDARVGVLRRGRLVPLPAGMNLAAPTRLLPLAFSPLFSWRAKLRMAMEPWIPPRRDGADESLAAFLRRRLGEEAVEVLGGPLLAGIYAGDPERLSAASAFPQLVAMERRGGLARALWTRRPAPRPGTPGAFATLKGGLSRVVEALARALPPRRVRTDCPALALRRRGGRWEVLTARGTVTADAVVAAVPAPVLADIIGGLDAELAARLREIPFVSTAVATLVYDAAALPRPLPGVGFLAPRGEGAAIAAATFSSNKFPARAPEGLAVARAFVGGAGREGDAEDEPAAIAARVREDFNRILGLGGLAPRAALTTRWLKANPQYEVGHGRRLERLESLLKGHPGLALAGCSYHGVGLPDCVRSGRRAAAQVLTSASWRNHAQTGLA
ncbi:MAG: protoporphyrinogen oxidase [Elusimicrobia bacterium]|nr:protoporphyrinogen oxidase [Elusimicrobiota bacterium]